MQQRHGALLDAALEAVAHHEAMAGTQLFDEAFQPGEIVAVVRVPHDDVAAARRGDSARQRCAVAALGNLHEASPCSLRQSLRAVARAVVGDQHLAGNSRALEEAARLGDAGGHRGCLVEAGHENRQLDHASAPRRPQKKRYPEGYL